MNKAITAHAIVAIAALFLIGAKLYKKCFYYVMAYTAIAFLMFLIENISNITLMLMLVSLSYFAQKFIVMMMMGNFLFKTTSVTEAISAMETMKFPKEVIIPFAVAMRFLPSIKDDYHHLKDSLKIRQIPISAGSFIFHPVRTTEYLIVPILIRSFKTSDELSASAFVRGIERETPKTILYPLKFRYIDGGIALMSTVIIGVLYWIQFK
jgi:energy-coupling factor transport system permease protein